MKKERQSNPNDAVLGRRDLMKLGVGAGVAAAVTPAVALAAQQGQPAPRPAAGGGGRGAAARANDGPTGGLQRVPMVQQWPEIAESADVVTSTTTGYTVHTGAGWKNTSGRHSGNGPMDEITSRLVGWTAKFSESQMTAPVITAINYLMLDFLACWFSGFETDPGRAAARLSQRYAMSGDFKSTVFGYGITTTPEMAAFANGGMGRHSDFDDHNSILICSCLAVGEALHSTGAQVMQAMAIAYEVGSALGGGFDSPGHVEFDNWNLAPAVACATGHLLGLNEDYLANAVSLALLPHMPLYSRIGTQTMWKGFHSAEQGRNGVFAALIARDGMTGPCMPFEARDGLLAHIGPLTRDVRLPSSADGRLAMETGHGSGRGGYKRHATEGTTQTFHGSILQPLRAWTKPEEIASMELENTYYSWQEICDPPKWDPQNRETADHSFPYNIARGILDGYIYFDSFAREKYTDPKARDLMAKLTVRPNPAPGFNAISLKVKKTSGEEKTFVASPEAPFQNDEIVAKFKKSADFFKIGNADQIQKTWSNLHDLKDIGQAIAVVSKLGNPKPLSDMSPARIS